MKTKWIFAVIAALLFCLSACAPAAPAGSDQELPSKYYGALQSGLKIRFSGYTGYHIEDLGEGKKEVTFPEIGFPPVYTKGKEFYTYTDAGGEYEWDGSYYADKIVPDKYWLHAGIEIEGEQYFKISAVYYVDTKKDSGGTYRYEYLWRHEEKPLLDTKSTTR